MLVTAGLCWRHFSGSKSVLCWEAKSYEIWKKGYGRVCRSVPSICLTLADLKDLLSSVWLPHSSLAWRYSFPVSSAWLVALVVASTTSGSRPWPTHPIPPRLLEARSSFTFPPKYFSSFISHVWKDYNATMNNPHPNKFTSLVGKAFTPTENTQS